MAYMIGLSVHDVNSSRAWIDPCAAKQHALHRERRIEHQSMRISLFAVRQRQYDQVGGFARRQAAGHIAPAQGDGAVERERRAELAPPPSLPREALESFPDEDDRRDQ